MAKRIRNWDNKKYQQRIKDGCGQGTHDAYKPWLTVQDVASLGKASRVSGMTTGRIHHLLSGLETAFFYILDWSEDVLDIREQFPLLDVEKAMEIADDMKVAYPADRISKEPYVMTTDFMVTTAKGEIAYSVKPAKELSNKRTAEKLGIERRYWESFGIEWHLITENEIDFQFAQNIEWMSQAHDLEVRFGDKDRLKHCLDAFELRYTQSHRSVQSIAKEVGEVFCLPEGSGIQLFQYLVLTRRIKTDMHEKISLTAERSTALPRDTTRALKGDLGVYPSLCVNQVVRDVRSEILYRVLWIDPDGQFLWWIALQENVFVPKKTDIGKITQLMLEGELEAADDPACHPPQSTVKARARRDQQWALVQEIVSDEPAIYDPNKRSQKLKHIADTSKISLTTLYRILGRYWRGGKTPNALLPNYQRSGGKGGRHERGDSWIGRTPAEDSAFGKILQEEDFRNFEKALHKYYLTQTKQLSLKGTYDHMLADSYCTCVTDSAGNEELKLLPKGQVPSMKQFRYWYRTNRNLQTETEKRKGSKSFELNSRRILGKSDYGQPGPGWQYQIDATVADIYLVSQFDRRNIIGRPVMYFVIDTVSRMVTGMYIGLEGPSWVGMMMALANAAADKTKYCEQFGVSITESDWPCHHLPCTLLGDRGELEGKCADPLVSELGIRVENTPPYRADLKGIIEQHFRTVDTTATVLLPGHVNPDMKERGGRDYRLDARLTIHEFTEIIIRCVLYHNNDHYMNTFERSEEMMRDSVAPIPREIWNWGMRACPGSLRVMPEEKVRLALMPHDQATVTERGVRFKGLFYSSEVMVQDLWFEKARAGKTYRVDVAYDPRNVESIYVWERAGEDPIQCFLLDWEQKYVGKQLDEIRFEQAMEQYMRQEHAPTEQESIINLNRAIESVVAEAESKMPDVSDIPVRQRTADIRENRKEERERIRQEESFTTDGHTPQDAQNTPPLDSKPNTMLPVEEMLWQQIMENVTDESLYGEGFLQATDIAGIQRKSND